MTDPDGLVLRYDNERLRFEPRSDGRWRVFDEEWTDCHWRTRGTRLADTLEFWFPTADPLDSGSPCE